MENSWSDCLKIHCWDPALAAQSAMRSVCAKEHLELLITHWLTCANLQFDGTSMPQSVLANHEYGPGEGTNLPHPGQFVGELAVHREPASRHWIGSAGDRQIIFEALREAYAAQVGRALQSSSEEKLVAPEFAIVRAHLRKWLEAYAFQ